jgi:hypothetical protein
MAAPPLRILCLHDANSNASILKDQLDILGTRLYENHGGIDLVYVNSPIVTTTVTAAHGRDSSDESLRVWWECSEEGKTTPSYLGLDASLLLLRQIWASSCPFWGILGVGQGAAVAALLTLTLFASDDTAPLQIPLQPPSFCIFVAGKSILQQDERLVEDVPCLHLLSSSETDDERWLLQQFGGSVSHCNNTNYFDKQSFNVIGRFIVQQQKKERRDDDNNNILALQHALHLTEQQASETIARHIALNPPAPLMAIIQPQAVAGRNDAKRRPEGGGAPCPAEFLLNREKRSNSSNSKQSRAHPKNEPEKA